MRPLSSQRTQTDAAFGEVPHCVDQMFQVTASILSHYTLVDEDLEIIRIRRLARNRLGFAPQLRALRRDPVIDPGAQSTTYGL